MTAAMISQAEAEELVGVAEIAEEYHVPRSTVSMWSARRASSGFPEPVADLSMGPVYRRTEVRAWYESKEGRRG